MSTENSSFDISSKGQIFLVKPMDFEKQQAYEFVMTVENAMTVIDPKAVSPSTARLIVKVADVNDNTPVVNGDSIGLVIEVNEKMKRRDVLAR